MPLPSSFKSTNTPIDPTPSKSDTMVTIEEYPSVIGPSSAQPPICKVGTMTGKTKILSKVVASKMDKHKPISH